MAQPEIVTFGCRLNLVESEAIRGLLGAAADTVVINTCAVTAEAERQGRQAIRRAARERPGAEIVVTGCAVQVNPAHWAALPGVARVLGNADKLRAAAWAPGASSQVSPASDIAAAADVAGFTGRTRGFVQVQAGCDHRCTFCSIPFGRGPNRSVAAAEVVRQVAALVERGVQEVVLTGVDIASHQDGIGALARAVLRGVPSLPRLRLSSLDPAALDDALWGLLADEPRLMPHLHLSLQAGSDLVLKRMRRRHSRAGALAAIARARTLRPGLAVGADLIAGFPTETSALFDETLAFVTEAAIPYLHVFPYSERPDTPAARMPAVPVPLRRERAARLRSAAAANAATFHAAQLGRDIRVLAEQGGTGHSEHFTPVRLAATAGMVVRARVVATDAHGLVAEAA
jgi:threonylcarbamoyladenosine tRNA methylthiotransferase MtaB